MREELHKQPTAVDRLTELAEQPDRGNGDNHSAEGRLRRIAWRVLPSDEADSVVA
jgi:hypothetical protein